MIPKTIHYCWFGRGPKPHLIRKCIESWRRVMPDYEIKEWNEDNFPMEQFPFAQEAYAEKMWAFVSDICRLYVLSKEGGIYLDTDVEVFKRFDCFLDSNFFAGTESYDWPEGEYCTLDASVFGCIPDHWFVNAWLNWYDGQPFRDKNGDLNAVIGHKGSLILLEHGYKRVNELQRFKDIVIYPTTHFTNRYRPYDKSTLYSLHHFDGSWTDDTAKRGKIFKWCRKHNLLHIYRTLESFKLRVIQKLSKIK